MSLIENLERDGWQDFFQNSFRYTLRILEEDRFRQVGSSVDDLRSWLTAGGVARVRRHLDEQMEMRRFSPARTAAVINYLERLVQENQGALLELIAEGIIPDCPTRCPSVLSTLLA